MNLFPYLYDLKIFLAFWLLAFDIRKYVFWKKEIILL